MSLHCHTLALFHLFSKIQAIKFEENSIRFKTNRSEGSVENDSHLMSITVYPALSGTSRSSTQLSQCKRPRSVHHRTDLKGRSSIRTHINSQFDNQLRFMTVLRKIKATFVKSHSTIAICRKRKISSQRQLCQGSEVRLVELHH